MQQRPMNVNNADIIANDVDDEESKVTAPAQVTVNQTGRFASISNVSFLSVQFIPVFANSHFLTCDKAAPTPDNINRSPMLAEIPVATASVH